MRSGELPWYGITRAEVGLLEQHGRDILAHAALFPGFPGVPGLSRIVELGPGNGTKLLTLLKTRHDGPAEAGHYGRREARASRLKIHLIDVSGKALDVAGRALDELGDIEVERHEATYESGLSDVAGKPHAGGRTLVLFLGSNIGNFDRPGAEEFLRTIRAALQPGDTLLLGADLVKPEADLLLAYDDPLGVTAAFNRNLLVRINRELGGDFDLQAFAHRAVWNARRVARGNAPRQPAPAAGAHRVGADRHGNGQRGNDLDGELLQVSARRTGDAPRAHRVSSDRALGGRRSALRAHAGPGRLSGVRLTRRGSSE